MGTHVPGIEGCRDVYPEGVRPGHGDEVVEGVGVKEPDDPLTAATEEVLLRHHQAAGGGGLRERGGRQEVMCM